MHTPFFGHAAAAVTILMWGVTFISTKVLLRSFTPVEILFTRFVIGFVALLLVYPHRFRFRGWREERLFAVAGVSGITLYFLLENIALTMTTASNVGVLVILAPFFTAILARWTLKAERTGWNFYVGFLCALAGVLLIGFGTDGSVRLNPLGDLLAVLACATWAVYSVTVRKIGEFGLNTVQVTRRIFFYGLLGMLPAAACTGYRVGLERYADWDNLGNMLFLGLGASALCFATWNAAVRILGAVKTSVYIYATPPVTVTMAALILGEPLTRVLIAGGCLALAGLWLSETKVFEKQ